jgi:hypothetical protein
VVGSSTHEERVAADVYQEELAARAAKHGFGFVDRKRQVTHPRAAAAYLSSYFVAGKRGKMTLRESVTKRDMPVSIVYIAPALSQRSGVTMRSLRLKRYLYMRAGSAWVYLATHYGLGLEDLVRAHLVEVDFLQLLLGAVRAAES